MEAEHWQKVERLYHAALEVEVSQRRALLEDSCVGDEELRREVESLLACHGKAEQFMEVPALEVMAKALAEDPGKQSPSTEDQGLLVGRTISQYRIVERLGEGGMGIVYKAEDMRLGRVVALKVIRGYQREPGRRRRLWQEARAAAQVSHPNACQLYELGQEKDALFLVMEFIEGESLEDRLKRGRLPPQEAAQIVLGMLSALEAFHRAGIVHRDLKPSNVLISSQGAKLLDFGIAKQNSLDFCDPASALPPDATMPGVFLGTPRYASPEQLKGERADARSDLFSVGAIFFEMLTGSPPFSGESFAEICHSVLHALPPALTGSAAISAFGRIARTALERDPVNRYPNADAMAAKIREALAMDGLDASVRARPVQRLMVLPFRILRSREEMQFLAFSLAEAITVSLAGLNDLIVRSSIVAARYLSDPLDLKRIAKEAEVDLVLIGTLLGFGDQLRITTQLVEVPSGTLVWSRSSEGTIRDLLQLHDDVVRQIVDSILPSLTPSEHQSLKEDRPASATVYELYLRANELSRKVENLPAAIEQYDRCIQMDASYAPAWARLGRARWLWDKYNIGTTEGLHSADEAFQVAFNLNPNLTLAHNFYTHVQVDQGRTLEALIRLLKRAHQRRSDAELFAGLEHVCRYCGLLQSALAAHREARRLDPLISTSVVHTYFMLGDYQRALETSATGYGCEMAVVLAALGRAEEAVSLLRQRELSRPWRIARLYLTSLRALLEGNREESLAAMGEIINSTFRDPEGMFYLARQLSYLGEESKSLAMLSGAVHNGFFCYPALLRDPWLDSLRSRTEFAELLSKAHELHRQASRSFVDLGGDSILGIQAEGY
jgi:serine/threonine protein kinase